MCLSPALPSGEDLVRHQLELQLILQEVHQRYAGRSGRYNKHDTARLRFIKDTAFPGLRFGKMVQERDMAMLRLRLTLAQLVSASRTSKGGARALSVSMRRVMS